MPALVAMMATGFAGFAVLMPVAPMWAAQGGANATGVGFVTGVFMFATVAVQLFVPSLLRRFGWALVLVAGLVLLGLPAPLHLASDALWFVLVLAAVRGAGFAILTVAGSSAVAELIEPARRGRAIGAFGLAIAAPQVVLLPLAPWAAEHLGFPVVFLAATAPVLGVVAAYRLGRRLDALPRHPDLEHPDLHGGVRRFAGLAPPVVLLLGVTLAGGAMLTFVPQLTEDAVLAMVALLLLTGLGALTRWGAGHFADRHGPRGLLWPSVLATVIGLSLCAWSAAGPGRAPALLAGMALIGLSYGALQNLTLGMAFAAVARRDQVTASAAWNIGFDLGTGIGAVIVGAIATGTSFSIALLAAAAVSLLTLPMAFLRPRVGARGGRT
jgi:MFS family permease